MDDESYQVREVYAHYGLAMYWAQCVEQAIFQNLVFFDLYPRFGKTVMSRKEWEETYDNYETKELRKTMGKLIEKLKKEGESTGEIQSLVKACLQKRNWLAHAYFSDRSTDITQVSGREIMIKELEEIQELFRETDYKINEITKPIMKHYGLTEEKLEEIMKDLQAKYNSLKTEQ